MAKEIAGRDESMFEATGRLADRRTNEADDIRMALARAVAGRKVPDEVVGSVAKKLAASKLQLRGIDVCMYGICIDYIVDAEQLAKALPEIVRNRESRLRGIELFPWGIPWPEIFRVRVEQEFDELAPFTTRPLDTQFGNVGANVGTHTHF